MPQPAQNPVIYEFGRFRFDAASKLLFFADEPVKLAPKVAECLALLVEANGSVVSKNDFFDKVWADTFVEDNALSYTISQLRKNLADHDQGNKYIETVPKRGFRFQAPISASLAQHSELIYERRSVEDIWIEETVDHELAESSPHLLTAPQTGKNRRWITAGIFTLLVAAFGVWYFTKPAAKESITNVKSIAVLPFGNFGDKEIDEPLRLRMTDALISKLGNLNTISIRPTNAILKYDGSDPVEFGRKLEVDAIVEGRIQREADNLRVTLYLISVATGEHLWADQVDGRADRLLDLQNALSSRLIGRLDVRLSDEQKTAFDARPTSSDEAYEAYQMGRYFWNKRSADGLRSSISAYQNAIRLDPKFAEAHVGLADSYFLLVDYSYDLSPENVSMANENLGKAIALKPELAEAYVTRGHIQNTYEWRWQESTDSLVKAIELAPNSPNAHHRYGMLLLKLRRYAEAEVELKKARQLDPTSPGINMNLGVVLYFSKQYERALEQFNKTVELDENFSPVRWYVARCLWSMGREKEALSGYVQAMRKTGDEESAAIIENGEISRSPKDVVAAIAAAWSKNVGSTGYDVHSIAVLMAQRGDAEAALKWLERAVAERHPWTGMIYTEPEFDFVRTDPRFKAIIKKMNLPDA